MTKTYEPKARKLWAQQFAGWAVGSRLSRRRDEAFPSQKFDVVRQSVRGVWGLARRDSGFRFLGLTPKQISNGAKQYYMRSRVAVA